MSWSCFRTAIDVFDGRQSQSEVCRWYCMVRQCLEVGVTGQVVQAIPKQQGNAELEGR